MKTLGQTVFSRGGVRASPMPPGRNCDDFLRHVHRRARMKRGWRMSNTIRTERYHAKMTKFEPRVGTKSATTGWPPSAKREAALPIHPPPSHPVGPTLAGRPTVGTCSELTMVMRRASCQEDSRGRPLNRCSRASPPPRGEHNCWYA